MQKIIPFKKEAQFKENVSEITSISLEHTLHKEKSNLITGEFLVSGQYKVVDTSSVIDHFSFHLPFDIHMDDKYDIKNTEIDIDDFYYEVINNDTLMVNIDVLVDKIEEKEKEKMEELELVRESEEEDEKTVELVSDFLKEGIQLDDLKIDTAVEPDFISEREKNIMEMTKEGTSTPIQTEDTTAVQSQREEISSVFDDIGNSASTSATYRIYITREEDTMESIMSKYSISKENFEKYNTMGTIKKGDKLIIPCMYSEKV